MAAFDELRPRLREPQAPSASRGARRGEVTCPRCGKAFEAEPGLLRRSSRVGCEGRAAGTRGCPHCGHVPRPVVPDATEILQPSDSSLADGDEAGNVDETRQPEGGQTDGTLLWEPPGEGAPDAASTPPTEPTGVNIVTDEDGKLTRLGPYEIIRFVAAGGMGSIYEAKDTRLNRRVALKVIRAGEGASREEIRRFKLEAESAAKLQHPNIVATIPVRPSGPRMSGGRRGRTEGHAPREGRP